MYGLPICVQTASVNCPRYCEGVLGWFACGGCPFTCACAGCWATWCADMPVVGEGCWCWAMTASCDGAAYNATFALPGPRR